MKNVLVINMGMKSIRSIIFDENGHKLSSAARPLTTAINDTRVEQDPSEWWEKGLLSMKEAVRDAGIKNIDYITVTTSASCLICVDPSGNPIGNALMVSDKRAVKEAEYIKNTSEFKEVFRDTGLDMSVSLMLPKILWIKNNEPEIFEKSSYFLTPNDFIIMKLCGEAVTDYLDAIKYHYNIDTKEYPEKLLNTLGISSKDLVDKINFLDTNKHALYIKEFDDIVSYIKNNVKDNDLVLTLGAGTVTEIGPMLLK